jgi:ribosomal protein S18 acetylase RimI-like enzyme
MTDARRLEELGLNSSAPPGQLLYDGWLLRLQPGKAKRARSVNAVYPSLLPLELKLAYCERLYRGVQLPPIFRITPFSDPPLLDDALATRGYQRFDETSVESTTIDAAYLREPAAESMDLAPWVDAVGGLRASSREQCAGHLARLQGMRLAMRPLVLRDERGVVATGLTIIEDEHAGLFDIVTREDARGRGHGRRMVTSLLRHAWDVGARHAYLQVESDNVAARRLYASFGFVERYRYWYRGRPGEW